MPCKHTLALATVLASATLFAACSRPGGSPTNDLNFYSRSQTGNNSQAKVAPNGTVKGSTQGNVALNQEVQFGKGTAQQQQQTQQTNEQKGPTMKTLADFEPITAKEVTISTNKGDIVFEIYQDKVPLTAANFLNLVKSGYYNGIRFHRVIEDFMAQVGDPLTKDESMVQYWGTGGPGYNIADEFDPTLKHDTEGTVSMANAGPNTGGSQFFITYGATPWLDGKHTVFGKVTKGMDVLRQIQVGDNIVKVSYQ
jgi:peptidyl-prolyl cis-trans isomerase B (cyclophilin B)